MAYHHLQILQLQYLVTAAHVLGQISDSMLRTKSGLVCSDSKSGFHVTKKTLLGFIHDMPAAEMTGAFEDLGEESCWTHSCSLSFFLSSRCRTMFLLSPGISEFRIVLFRIEKGFLAHNQCKPPSKVQVHQLLPNCLACIQAMKPQCLDPIKAWCIHVAMRDLRQDKTWLDIPKGSGCCAS